MPRYSLHQQRRPLLFSLLLIYAPLFGLLALTWRISSAKAIPLATFVRDSAAVAGVPFYTGALSNIGILLWCASAVLCLFSFSILSYTRADISNRRFFLLAGLLTTLLLLDDLFLIHERFLPDYLGLSSNGLYAFYAVLLAALLFVGWKLLRQSAYMLILLSLACLGGSFGLDFISDMSGFAGLFPTEDIQYFVEDGFKLLGIAGWFSFFAWLSHAQLMAVIQPSAPAQETDWDSSLGRATDLSVRG